jgi:thiol-disulfide isomerase/thioredoxin
MKITKSKIYNLVFIVFIAALFYPPIGTPIRVLIKRVISFSPSIIDANERKSLDTYNWQLKNMKGESYDFNSAKDKVVLVNLWATWCPDCIAEMPSLQALYNDYGKKVEFLFVTNDSKEKIEAFMHKKGYNFPVYNESSEIPSVLYSRSIPATYLISKKGEIVISKINAANWNSDTVRNTIDELLD